MKRLALLISTFLVLQFSFGQDDPVNNHYLMNQAILNPAYNGVHDMANVTVNTRGQWVGVEGAPITHMLSMASTFSDHSTTGLMFIQDDFGINSTTHMMFSYAYRINMYGNFFSFGLQGGISNYVMDWNKLNQEAPDPSIGTGRYAQRENIFGFGMMYKTDNFYFGLASPRMLDSEIIQNDIIVNAYEPTYNASIGFLFEPVEFFKIKPSAVIRYTKNDDVEIDLNGQVLINEAIWLGISSRNFGTGGVNIVYSSDDIYHFGYAFEFPFSEIGTTGYGTHEIMISIDMKFSDRHVRNGRFF